MLVNKGSTYASGDVVSFKLVNGDEIVAKVLEQSDEGFSIQSPCTVMPSQQGLGLMQSLFSTKDDCKVFLSKSHVMLHAESLEEMRVHYIKITTGVDVIAKPGIIV
jgi:hypothetical protein